MIYARFNSSQSRQGYTRGHIYRIRIHRDYVHGTEGQPPYELDHTEAFFQEWEIVPADLIQERNEAFVNNLNNYYPDQEL